MSILFGFDEFNMNEVLQNKRCSNCKEPPEDIETELYIFMSFSVPENAWISLSQEAVGKKVVFVLRGLPDNSFTKLAQRIFDLRNKGMTSSVQVHPGLFNQYGVSYVPTFVMKKGNEFDKVSGNISLKAALNFLKEGNQ